MDFNFESNLDNVSDEVLKYVGITNLDFRTSLSSDDLEEVKRMLFSINTLMQVTFRDGATVKDIENVKYILELSPMCNDNKVEKMILRENTPVDVKKILSLSFLNPETWNISYQVKDGTYMITSLPNYRVMEEYISIVLSCVDDSMSTLEKVKEIYDFVKLLELDEKASSRLPDIVISRKTNSFGFNMLFSEILKRIGISSYIGEVKRNSSKEYITIIDINDDKYDAHGIYAFDPASDSIDKDVYKSDAIRKVNYNFFCRTLLEIENTKFDDKLDGSLMYLISDSFEFSCRRVNERDKRKLEDSLGYSYFELFDKIHKTKSIKDDNLLDLVMNTIHKDDFLGLNRDISELVRNNYFLRKKELFNEIKESEVEYVNIHDA